MKISAELSLYPLKTNSLENAINRFIDGLSQAGVPVNPGPMSTMVVGDSEKLFRIIATCFEKACRDDEVVLIAKFSNACASKAVFMQEYRRTNT